jgi:polyphosphate kinase 2 (PPK2 family)
LPAAEELVLFNRSWYNRAGVERVMGFCTEAEHEQFVGAVSSFESMLVSSGVKLLKY